MAGLKLTKVIKHPELQTHVELTIRRGTGIINARVEFHCCFGDEQNNQEYEDPFGTLIKCIKSDL